MFYSISVSSWKCKNCTLLIYEGKSCETCFSAGTSDNIPIKCGWKHHLVEWRKLTTFLSSNLFYLIHSI